VYIPLQYSTPCICTCICTCICICVCTYTCACASTVGACHSRHGCDHTNCCYCCCAAVVAVATSEVATTQVHVFVYVYEMHRSRSCFERCSASTRNGTILFRVLTILSLTRYKVTGFVKVCFHIIDSNRNSNIIKHNIVMSFNAGILLLFGSLNNGYFVSK
jgi:hypothetical protein